MSDETDALCVSLVGSGVGRGLVRCLERQKAPSRPGDAAGGDPVDLRPMMPLDFRDQSGGSQIPTLGWRKRASMHREVRALQQVHKVPGLLFRPAVCSMILSSGQE